jgi:BirA family biotin operon repressor/biotin-[acetyl-CoA-carboxylase] ligase
MELYMKGRILQILRSERGVVSGQVLSTELGISRVSVWKHIHKLKEYGYSIHSTPKGYQLSGDPDVPYPWEFPARESKIHYFSTVSSTMDIARQKARNECPDFTVVIAGHQDQGRGRLNRSWHSAEGGLYLTIVLRPTISPVLSPRLGFAASLALVQTLRSLYGIDAMVKWPNDILVAERKVSGMLAEMEAETDRIKFINIGLGINVNNDPTPVEPSAISLRELLGRSISRKKLLAEFLDRLERQVNPRHLETVLQKWKQYSNTIGRHVKIITHNETSEGTAVDVDDNGALILQLADGSYKKIIYGDCFHHPG